MLFWRESPRSLLWGGYFWAQWPPVETEPSKDTATRKNEMRFYVSYGQVGKPFDSVAPIREDGWYWFSCSNRDYRYSELHGPYPDSEMAMANCSASVSFGVGVS